MRSARPCLIALLALATACDAFSEPPLEEAIVGEWEIVCRTRDESVTSCAEREREYIFYQTFHADGRYETEAVGGGAMEGRWTLEGDVVEIVGITGGGIELREQHRLRVVDGQLVFWTIPSDFGAIYERR